MNNAIMIDNWTLQEVCELYNEGISDAFSSEIHVDREKDSHDTVDVPHAIIQIEALLDVLVNIVVRDSLIVDDHFTHAWENTVDDLDILRRMALIRPFPFLSDKNRIREIRTEILEILCVTSTLRQVQKENEQSVRETGKFASSYYSATIWGGAGMLARSDIYKLPYHGHPIRRKLFQETSIFTPKIDAAQRVLNFIQDNRVKVFSSIDTNKSHTYSTFNISPIAVEIINNSSSYTDLIGVALQLRDKYKDLRDWISEFQEAIDNENPKSILTYEKRLQSVSKIIDSNFSPSDNQGGSTTIEIALGFFNISWSSDLPNRLANSFGTRATLNRLIMAPRGINSIEKLISMFGAGNTRLGMAIKSSLAERLK